VLWTEQLFIQSTQTRTHEKRRGLRNLADVVVRLHHPLDAGRQGVAALRRHGAPATKRRGECFELCAARFSSGAHLRASALVLPCTLLSRLWLRSCASM
jgi:hypothetical protein